MRYARWVELTAAIGAAILPFGQSVDPPPKPAVKPDELQQFDLKTLAEHAEPGPVNGITLRIKAKQELVDDFDTIHVDWMIEYTGPRAPVAILRPSLTETRNNATTELMIFAAGKNGETYGYGLRNPVEPFAVLGSAGSGRKSFLKIPKHQSDGDKFVVDTAQIRRHLRRRKPEEFDPEKPPKLYMKLHFSTDDRGEAHNLDAWTGKLESNLVPVPLSEW
jgi:hypothetical protein